LFRTIQTAFFHIISLFLTLKREKINYSETQSSEKDILGAVLLQIAQTTGNHLK
jgi:hypothetical protein